MSRMYMQILILMNNYFFEILLLIFLTILSFSCKRNGKEVIVYIAHDQVYSEPILKEFELKTGIKVKALYDTEAVKTVGLVNRLIAENNNPQCDVFWNNEVIRTIVLKKKGILSPYNSPAASEIPGEFRDSGNCWTGFAARARVIVYNTTLIKKNEIPTSIFDFLDKKWSKKFAISYPIFGTFSSQCAGLFSLLGDEKARGFFKKLKNNNPIVVDGNSVVKDKVAHGEVPAGITDTDDAYGAILDGYPIKMIYPDQSGIGTFLIPNTISLIKGAPHPEEGKKLIDYILSKEVESKLAFSRAAQMPLRHDVKRPENVLDYKSIINMSVDYEKITEKVEISSKFLQELFIR